MIAAGVSATALGNAPVVPKTLAVEAIKEHALKQAAVYASPGGEAQHATANALEAFRNLATTTGYVHPSVIALVLKGICLSTVVLSAKVAPGTPAIGTAFASLMARVIAVLNTEGALAKPNAQAPKIEVTGLFAWGEGSAMCWVSVNAQVYMQAMIVPSSPHGLSSQ